MTSTTTGVTAGVKLGLSPLSLVEWKVFRLQFEMRVASFNLPLTFELYAVILSSMA